MSVSAPSGLGAAVQSATTIRLTWSNNGVYDFIHVERQDPGQGWHVEAVVDGTDVQFDDVACQHGTLYYYRIRAEAAGEFSDYTASAHDTTTLPAPTALAGSVIGPTRIDLSWALGSTVYDSIHIERKPSGGSYAEIDSIGGTETGYQDTNITQGVTYLYKIRAYHNSYSSKYSDYTSEITVAGQMTAPSNLQGEADSTTAITIWWQDNSASEEGFKIYRDGVYLASVGANVEEYQNTGLTEGQWYRYKVTAYAGAVETGFSNEIWVKAAIPPAKPSSLTATAVSSTRIDLAWQDNSPNETGFKIEESTDGVNYSQIDTVAANVTSYSRTGLTTLTPYWYRVRSYNGDGNSGYSNVATTTTFAGLSTPSNLVVSALSDTIAEITFDDNSSTEDDHRVERKLGAGAYSEVQTLEPNRTYWKDTGLAKGQTYTYRVRAKQGVAYSSYSAEVTVTTLNDPAAPTGLTISEVKDKSLRLSWSMTASQGETGIKIEKSTNGTDYAEIEVVDIETTNFKVTGLSAGTQYWFKIRSYSIVGNSSYTSAETDTTDAAYEETALEEYLRKPNITPIYRLKFHPKMDLSGWTLPGGSTYTYSLSIGDRLIDIDAVYENGAALTEQASWAAVESTAGSWLFDFQLRLLYVHTTAGTSPANFLMEAGFYLYFTNYQDGTIIFNDRYYWPLTSSRLIPEVSQEITPLHEGGTVISAGTISLYNARLWGEHYFDKLYSKITWRGSTMTLEMGGPGFADSDFEPIFSAQIYSVECRDLAISFDLRDIREDLECPTPPHQFWASEYPNIDPSLIGTRIPFLFGSKTGCPLICIDAANKRYKFQDGRANAVTAVKKNGTAATENSDFWVDYKRGVVTFAAGYTITDGDELTIDFDGVPDSAGALITNGADIFKHMIGEWFGLAHAEMALDEIYETKATSTATLAAYLGQDSNLSENLQMLEHSLRAYVFQDAQGRLGIRPVQTTVPSNVIYLRDHEIREFSKAKSKESIYRELNVFYGHSPADDTWSVKNYINRTHEWKFKARKALDIYTYLTASVDAVTVLNAIAGDLDKDFVRFKAPARLMRLLAGDLVKFSRNRFYSLDGAANEITLRIIRISKSPSRHDVEIEAERIA